MSKEHIVPHQNKTETALAELEELAEKTKVFAENSKAESTKKSYRRHWADFCSWGAAHGFENLPARPEVVATYATHLAQEGLGISSIGQAMAAISQAHQLAKHDSPTKAAIVRATLRGIRRTLGVAPDQKAAVSIEELRTMVERLPDGLRGTRDRALLLVGFSGAFRRSELSALDVDDIEVSDRGALIHVRKSKTDQEGAGGIKAIPRAGDPDVCPVLALLAWLDAANIECGAVFRTLDRWGNLQPGRASDRAIARAVQSAARAAGLDPQRFAGHSLRAGFATSAVLAGKSESSVMRQTGHRSVTVFRGYVRVADAWRDNAAKGLL